MIIIYGTGDTIEKATADHNRKFEKFLIRCREKGIKLNRKKLQLLTTEVTHMGYLVTNEGLRADHEKTNQLSTCPSQRM